MQRCQFCGQLNDDVTDHCVFCGEAMYIQVDHDMNRISKKDLKRQYAAKVAQELLEDEERKKNRQNLFDDLDDFAKELLEDNNTIYIDEDNTLNISHDETYTDLNPEDKYIYQQGNNRNINHQPEEDENNREVYHQTQNEPVLYEEEIEDEYLIDKQEDSITVEQDTAYPQIEEGYTQQQQITPEELEKIYKIEELLKKRIKRNKKLENQLGLDIQNTTLTLNNKEGPINIVGNIIQTKPAGNRNTLKLSVKCFDKQKQPIADESITLPADKLDEYNEFNITINTDIKKINIIIIVPELLNIRQPEQKSEKAVQEPVRQKRTQNIKDRIIPQRSRKCNANKIFLEQMKDIERKIGINIDNTSVLVKSDERLEIVGEIYIENPEKCKDIKIATTCYDEQNNILTTKATYINTKLFLGFDTLDIVIDDADISQIRRIRLYPTFQN